MASTNTSTNTNTNTRKNMKKSDASNNAAAAEEPEPEPDPPAAPSAASARTGVGGYNVRDYQNPDAGSALTKANGTKKEGVSPHVCYRCGKASAKYRGVESSE